MVYKIQHFLLKHKISAIFTFIKYMKQEKKILLNNADISHLFQNSFFSASLKI